MASDGRRLPLTASNGDPLLPRYVGEVGQDAGGLRRMFFDLFAHELAVHPLWTLTPTGSLRPADSFSAAVRQMTISGELEEHMRTVGRVCGMALYQELHRHSGVQTLVDGERAPPNLFGVAFARYFIQVVQHAPPDSLAELQAALAAETLETQADVRTSPSLLDRPLSESGLGDMVRRVLLTLY